MRYIFIDKENVVGRCKEVGIEFFEVDNGREDKQEQRGDDGDIILVKEGGENRR